VGDHQRTGLSLRKLAVDLRTNWGPSRQWTECVSFYPRAPHSEKSTGWPKDGKVMLEPQHIGLEAGPITHWRACWWLQWFTVSFPAHRS
jgi:hypothetical protein